MTTYYSWSLPDNTIIYTNSLKNPKEIFLYPKDASKLETKLFNKDAFTVVGNPSITDNGVASGFSGSDYLNTDCNWSQLYNKNIVFTARIIVTEQFFTSESFVFGTASSGFTLSFYGNENRVAVFSYNGGSWDATSIYYTRPNIGDAIDITITKTNNLVKLDYVSKHDNLTSTNNNLTFTSVDTPLVVGFSQYNRPFLGKIDLSRFSITVDGVEVFNGANSLVSDLVKLSTADNISISNNVLTFDTDKNQVSAIRKESLDFNSTSVVTNTSTFLFIKSKDNTDLVKDNQPCFNITRDYITSLIPDNLRETWVFERVADIIYATISDTTTVGNEIKKYYYDVEFFSSDFTKLSLETKRMKLKDMGFGYLLDIFLDEDTDTKINNIGSYLNLLKSLKGRLEGFKIILDTFGFVYKTETWLDREPKGEIFTIDIVFSISSTQGQLTTELTKKLQNIARNYLAPAVNIQYIVISDLVTTGCFNAKYSGGYLNYIRTDTFTITRSL